MVFLEPSQLGWETLHKSFMLELQNKGLTEVYLNLYESLVDWLIPPMLDLLKSCQQVIRMTPLHSYRMLTTFFMNFIAKQANYNQIWFQQIFLFCFAWSYCSCLTIEGSQVCRSSAAQNSLRLERRRAEAEELLAESRSNLSREDELHGLPIR